MKPPLRTKSVGTKVSEEEFAVLETRARARKLTLSEWVRAELLEPKGEGGGAADEVLLGEVLALRTYTLLEGMTAKGQGLFLKGDQVEAVTDPDGQQAGRQGWRLTEAGAKLEIARLQWVTGTFNDRALHRLLGSVVYADVEGWEFYRVPVYTALAFFVLLLFVAVPRDRKRRMIWKHGRRLRGPEVARAGVGDDGGADEKLGKSKLLTTTLPDGVAPAGS